MPGRHRLAIAPQGTDDMQGVLLRQLRFAGATQILKQLGPGLQSSPANNLVHGSADLHPAAVVDGGKVSKPGLNPTFSLSGVKGGL